MNEFDLIAAIQRGAATLPDNGFEGIGDDCAILPLGDEALVFTTDALCEGVHFLREATSARALGHKTLAVNLSDVAAMGVRPVAVLLSLSLPRTVNEEWAEEFMAGFLALARRHDVALIGGDTTRSEGGIALSVTAIGRGPLCALKRRNAAQAGDTILVSDRLGASAAGLRDLLAGRLDTPLADRHRLPAPEIEAGAWLGTREEVHAMMDLSDGLQSDLRHILNRSGVSAAVELVQLPLDEGVTLNDAVAGGEDYKLLLTASSERSEELCRAFEEHFHRPLYPIGRIIPTTTPNSTIHWLTNGNPTPLVWHSFNHFE